MRSKKYSDFRSDTVTKPTNEMRKAMANAKVGDDVLGDDYTVKKLEKLAAKLTGKERALFVPSGTMANELAVKLWTNEGDEIILDSKSHIYAHELSGISVISRVLPKALDFIDGIPPIDKIEDAISLSGKLSFRTSLICLENTHNHRGGVIVPLNYFKELRELCDNYNIKIHLDGARIFNASIASGIAVKDYCAYVDSVMFCLSKGLSAPVGSILCGPRAFIENARRWRRLLGGSMRQAGILASAGIVALNNMVSRLSDDHKRAKFLAFELSKIKAVELNPEKVQTNIVIFKLKNNKLSVEEFLRKLRQMGILALPMSKDEIRFVTHKDVDDDDVNRLIEACRKILS
jgi:threonine aldolase